MSLPTSTRVYGVAVGEASTMVPYVTTVAPATTNVTGPNGNFQIGQMWVNKAANTVYILTSVTASAGGLSATWTSV